MEQPLRAPSWGSPLLAALRTLPGVMTIETTYGVGWSTNSGEIYEAVRTSEATLASVLATRKAHAERYPPVCLVALFTSSAL